MSHASTWTFIVGWPSGLLCRAVDTARPIRPAGQPRPALISVLSIAYSFHSALFSTFLWLAALSSGQRRWRFPPFGTLPGAAFLPVPSTVSLDSYIFGSPLRRLRSCVADFPHSASHSLQSCGIVGVIPSTVGRPSCVRTPSLQQNFSARILHSAAASLTHKSCGTLRDPRSGRLRRPAAGKREFVWTRAAAAPGKQGKVSSPRLECGNRPCYQQRS